MAKNKFTLLLLLVISSPIFAGSNTAKFIVYFKDKELCENAAHLFSEKALQKRQKYAIAFDQRDIPVNPDYVSQLEHEGIKMLNTSGWLNAAMVRADEIQFSVMQKMPFINRIVQIATAQSGGIASEETEASCNEGLDYEDTYVNSFPQFHLLNGEYLHEQGYNGENMTIAICDNGFYNAQNNAAFSEIFTQNRIKGTYDYVHGDSAVYEESGGSHGSNCFSLIGGIKTDKYLGTAVKSDFYLFQTENNSSERLQEEFNLAAALERCSQLGVDVVNISLGYTTFDVPAENHDSTDLMNNSTPAAQAVNMAASKGMIVCVAAGNEGNKTWKYISTPADADSAFTIASVDINGNVDPSSGHGLATDPRVKPNVAAVGWGANIINTSNQVVSGRGTSYASPSVAGLSACLWQAFPSRTAWEIKTAIEQSASQYLTPDKRMGYGIPDFKKAFQILANASYVYTNLTDNDFVIYPNPFQQTVYIDKRSDAAIQSVQLLNQIGQVIYAENTPSANTISLATLSSGMYIMQIATDKGMYIKKLIKD
jgi:serine protease AprX